MERRPAARQAARRAGEVLAANGVDGFRREAARELDAARASGDRAWIRSARRALLEIDAAIDSCHRHAAPGRRPALGATRARRRGAGRPGRRPARSSSASSGDPDPSDPDPPRPGGRP